MLCNECSPSDRLRLKSSSICLRHGGPPGIALLDLWCRRCSPLKVPAAKELHKMVQSLSARSVFGEQVRGIDLAVHLAQINAACSDSLLDP